MDERARPLGTRASACADDEGTRARDPLSVRKPEMGDINPRFAYTDGIRTVWRFQREWGVSGILVLLCI